MPYWKRPACEDPSSVIVQDSTKQVARSVFFISGFTIALALAITVIPTRSGIHFENVFCSLIRD